jgi:hypothetical protein
MKMRTLLIFLFIATHAFAGYDVHITRRKVWTDDEGPAISLREWKDYVSSDLEMRLDGFAETTTKDGQKLRVQSEGLAVWTKYSKHGKDGNMAWFNWFRGEITVKNPDREIRGKMFRIAQKLGARVQGDEGEFYDETGMQVP